MDPGRQWVQGEKLASGKRSGPLLELQIEDIRSADVRDPRHLASRRAACRSCCLLREEAGFEGLAG
eukprot:614530-Pyramimonas_sp.AAC.1